jgi:hypothetical protein
MTSAPAAGAARPDERVQDEFLDLVLADEQLLRAEFEALMRESWPDEPAATTPRPVRPVLPRRPPRHWTSQGVSRRLRRPAIEAAARQRSPPAGADARRSTRSTKDPAR